MKRPAPATVRGGFKRHIVSWSSGACGAKVGASSATDASASRTAMPSNPKRFCRRSLRIRLRVVGCKAGLPIPNPWIDDRIQEVDDKVDDHKHRRHDEHRRLDQRVVTGEYRGHDQAADTRPCEDHLGDDGTAKG